MVGGTATQERFLGLFFTIFITTQEGKTKYVCRKGCFNQPQLRSLHLRVFFGISPVYENRAGDALDLCCCPPSFVSLRGTQLGDQLCASGLWLRLIASR